MADTPPVSRIRELLAERDISPLALSVIAGIDTGRLVSALNGERRFTSLELARIAEGTGVTVLWLLGEDRETPAMAHARIVEEQALKTREVELEWRRAECEGERPPFWRLAMANQDGMLRERARAAAAEAEAARLRARLGAAEERLDGQAWNSLTRRVERAEAALVGRQPETSPLDEDDLLDLIPNGGPIWADSDELAAGHFTDRDYACWRNILGHPKAHPGCCATCGCASPCLLGGFHDAVMATTVRSLLAAGVVFILPAARPQPAEENDHA